LARNSTLKVESGVRAEAHGVDCASGSTGRRAVGRALMHISSSCARKIMNALVRAVRLL